MFLGYQCYLGIKVFSVAEALMREETPPFPSTRKSMNKLRDEHCAALVATECTKVQGS